ncbi:hypothetical protein [Staphylococcus shinii]|uniref:hypothetical protein n=1 Tax=Staphylococcus shinii TaxID=2912228 RepID=UPI003F574A85
MKKLFFLILTSFLILSACEDGSSQENTSNQVNKEKEQKKKEDRKKTKDKQNKKILNFKSDNGFYDDYEDSEREGDKYIEKMNFKNVNSDLPTLTITTNKNFKNEIPFDQKEIAKNIIEENWATAKNTLTKDPVKGDLNIKLKYYDGKEFAKANKYRKNSEVEFGKVVKD